MLNFQAAHYIRKKDYKMEIIAVRGVPARPSLVDAMLSLVKPQSCLTTKLPLRFHGLYEAMAVPGIVLAPAGAPDIDVLAHNDSLKLADAVDNALRFTNVYERCGAEKDKFIRQARRLLKGECSALDDWRIWQISIEQDYTLGIHLANRENDIVFPITTIRLPLPLEMDVDFQIRDETSSRSRHKLNLSTHYTEQHGRTVRLTEWIEGCEPASVLLLLDWCPEQASFQPPDAEIVDRLRGS